MTIEVTKSSTNSSTYHNPVKWINKDVIASSITVNLEVQDKKPKVIVAIPAYNEEIAIASVVLRSLKYADRVVVVDDGSKDKTAEIARLAGADVLPHLSNGGKGVAIKDAFAYAKKENADILVLIDGDGQHNPDEIPSLLIPILKGEADLVNGSRFVNGNEHNVPAYRRLGQEVLTVATNAGAKMRITDTQNGFRAFSKKTFDCFSFHQNGMAIESEMLIDAAQGKKILKPVGYRNCHIHGSCKLYGNNKLGNNCTILENVMIGYPSSLILNEMISKDQTFENYPFNGVTIGDNALIRPNTTIYCDVTIGDNLRTGHNALVRENTTIGNNVLIGTNVIIDGNTKIGNNVSIQGNVYIPMNTVIEDHVFLGPCCVLTNDKYPIRVKYGLVGPVLRKGVSVGANSTILPGIEVGEGAMIAAGSLVTKDVPAWKLAIGAPAKIIDLPEKLKNLNRVG